jgi:hypothetical protein
LLSQARETRDIGWREFVTRVNELRRAIVVAIVEGQLAPETMDRVLREIDAIMNRYNYEFAKEMSQNQKRLFLRGIQTVDQIVRNQGLQVSLPYVSEVMLTRLQEFSASLITRLTNDARSRIDTEIRLGVLGQKPIDEIVSVIGSNLKDPSVFTSIAARARVIYETETRRIQNLTAAERMKQTAVQVPELEKMWLHSHRGIPRPNHLAMDHVRVPAAGNFELPGIDGGVYLVTAPHDPVLPAEETVNCGCIVVSVVPRFAKTAAA